MTLIKEYPKEILEIAERYIRNNTSSFIKAIVPIYARGFVVVLEDSDGITYKPYIEIGSHIKDGIKLEKSHWSFDNYDEAMIALITFRNLGDCNTSKTYIDIFCNKMGVTKNSINPYFG